MLVSSCSSLAMFSKFDSFEVTTRLEKRDINSKAKEVEFEKATLQKKNIYI